MFEFFLFPVLLRLALENFEKMVKPGGILVVDHRNYDFIVENGSAPTHNIYYNVYFFYFIFIYDLLCSYENFLIPKI